VRHHAQKSSCGSLLVRLCQLWPEVAGLPEVRLVVVEAMGIDDDVGVPASFGDGSIVETVPHSGRPLILGVTLVHDFPSSRETWTRPSSLPAQRFLLHGGLGDGEDGANRSRPRCCRGEGPPDHFCLGPVVAGQIAAQGLPGGPLVGGAEQDVGRVNRWFWDREGRSAPGRSTGSGP